MTATATGPGTTLTPVTGRYIGIMNDPDFQAISAIEDPNMRSFAMMDLLSRNRSKTDYEQLPAIIGKIREQQFQDYQRFRPYAFGDLVARNFVEGITKIPGQIAQARQMYGPEAATAFGKQVQGLNAPTVPRYF